MNDTRDCSDFFVDTSGNGALRVVPLLLSGSTTLTKRESANGGSKGGCQITSPFDHFLSNGEGKIHTSDSLFEHSGQKASGKRPA